MNLNTDIKQLFGQKKEVYPTKKQMNLYFKADKATTTSTAILYIAFIVVLIFGATKVFVYDKIHQVAELKEASADLDTQIADYTVQLKDYKAVLEEYTRYAPTEQELLLVDRMEILDMLDRIIRPYSDITDIMIQENQVFVTFSGVTLDQTAKIVAELEKSPLVDKTDVDTAFSNEHNRDIVDVSILIQVSKEDGHEHKKINFS